jgi:hypothetical protein
MTVVVDDGGDVARSWWGFLFDLSGLASLNPLVVALLPNA